MIAAPIWHWWMGLAMLGAGVFASLSLIVGYLRSVSSQRYPGGRRAKEREL